jgi:TonB family protein
MQAASTGQGSALRRMATLVAALLLGAIAASLPAGASAPSGNAGVCVKLDNGGHVIAARITESSGDRRTDDAIVELATQVHWDKPYPRAGWMPMRLGVGSAAQSLKPTPSCDQSVEAAASPAPLQHRHRHRVIRAVSTQAN